VNKYYPQYYHKTDKVRHSGLWHLHFRILTNELCPQDGRPIYIEVLGKLDLPKLYAATTEDRLLKRLVLEYERFITERLPAVSAEIGHPVETSCTILDLNNVSLRSFYQVKNYLSEASAIGQNYYPECMGKFYIINAPYLFSTVWAFIKPWLDEVTVKKIQIISTGHKAVLTAQIDEANLPEEFGGTCKCAGGCSLSDEGPWKRHSTGTAQTSGEAPVAPTT
jgi:CRAL/TRIO domain